MPEVTVEGDPSASAPAPEAGVVTIPEVTVVGDPNASMASAETDNSSQSTALPDGQQFPPDWQHGAPTKPVAPDPHVWPPEPEPKPTSPYRDPSPPPPEEPQPDHSTLDTLAKIAAVVAALGIAVALIPTIAAAIADPEPATKLALIGLTAVEIGALAAALGFKFDPLGLSPEA